MQKPVYASPDQLLPPAMTVAIMPPPAVTVMMVSVASVMGHLGHGREERKMTLPGGVHPRYPEQKPPSLSAAAQPEARR